MCSGALAAVATVHSGRRGVSAEVASSEFWTMFDGVEGISENSRFIPEALTSASSGANYAVWKINEQSAHGKYIGTVNLGGNEGRILAMN